MEQKNRLIITVLVIVLIVGAMFTSFGRSFFTLNTAQIQLPGSASFGSDNAGGENSTDHYLTVEATPKTVQSIIATLSRSDSYYREITVERFWGEEESSSSRLQVWVDEDWTHVRQVTPTGAVRHDMLGPEEGYYWYEGSFVYRAAAVDELSADLAQQMPTYETILDLDQDDITGAGYEARGGLPCVYAEMTDPELDYRYRYWVNIQSGLLISAEIETGAGELVYRLSAYTPIQSPCPSSASFALPDGSVLHTV